MVCQDFSLPPNFAPSMLSPLLDHQYEKSDAGAAADAPINDLVVRFVACGDLSGFDAPAHVESNQGTQQFDEAVTPT